MFPFVVFLYHWMAGESQMNKKKGSNIKMLGMGFCRCKLTWFHDVISDYVNRCDLDS